MYIYMYIFIQLIPYEEVTLYGIGLRIYGLHFLVATLWCQTWLGLAGISHDWHQRVIYWAPNIGYPAW